MIKRGLNHRLAEVGKIKIGGKGQTRKTRDGKSTYQLPTRYDHFVVTTTAKGNDGNFIPDKKIMDILGPNPTELKVRLLFDDTDMNFYTSFAFYQGAKCMCRGDGEIAEMLFLKGGKTPFTLMDKADGKWVESSDQNAVSGERMPIICNTDTCPHMQPDNNGATRCKPSGILSCLLEAAPAIGGVYRFRTHSWNTISNILSSLDLIKTISGGVLTGLPLRLQMLKKATDGHGNVNTVNIEFDGENYQEMRQQALLELDNRTKHSVNMLKIEKRAKALGFLDDTDDPADIETEFYIVDLNEPAPEQAEDITDRAGAVLGQVEIPVAPEEEEQPVIGDPESPPVIPPEDEPEETPEPESADAGDDGLEIF